MRKSKYVGFLAISLGLVLIVGAAVLPVSPNTQRFGPFRVNLESNCGPAGWVVFHQTGTVCGDAAERRLAASTAIGLLVLALGMALFAGGDEARGSRVEVSSPRVSGRRPSGTDRPGLDRRSRSRSLPG